MGLEEVCFFSSPFQFQSRLPGPDRERLTSKPIQLYYLNLVSPFYAACGVAAVKLKAGISSPIVPAEWFQRESSWSWLCQVCGMKLKKSGNTFKSPKTK
jgi:hypothetical protein